MAQPISAVVFVSDLGELRWPREVLVDDLAVGPRRAAQQLGGPSGGHVAHHLDAAHEGDVVAASFDLGHGCEERHAARRTRRLVPGCGQSVEGRVDGDEHRTEGA